MSGGSVGGIEREWRPPRNPKPGPASKVQLENLNLKPLLWTEFFDHEYSYTDPAMRIGRFHCYSKGTLGKACIVLIHGGGYSALTFGVLTEYLSSQIGSDVEILAVDLRGHGSTHADHADLKLDTFSEDIMAVLGEHFSPLSGEWPPIILVGHSLGGAIAVDVAHKLPRCAALVMLDVSESIAMDSLAGMKSLLRARPNSFPTIQTAIYWAVKNKTIASSRSARLSVPGMIKNEKTNVLAAEEIYLRQENEMGLDATDVLAPSEAEEATAMTSPLMSALHHPQMEALIEKSDEEDDEQCPDTHPGNNADASTDNTRNAPSTDSQVGQVRYVWRIDLMQTEPFWTGWYHHLSQKFLAVSTQAKLLILAKSTEALDRDADMLRGHITGKFTVQTVTNSGHMLQENVPEIVGNHIIQLLKRHRLLDVTDTEQLYILKMH